MSFKTLHIPKECHNTNGTLVPKKTPGLYRIIHVSSPMAALLDLVALHRLEYRLEHNNLLSSSQYGFTALRGRHDFISRIIEIVTDNQRSQMSQKTKKCCTIISFDIEGAFDNIDHDKLINKMIREFGNGKISYWLTKFILNRKIEITYEQLRSRQSPKRSTARLCAWPDTLQLHDQ